MAADGEPQEDGAGSDVSECSGASSSSPSPADTLPAPPPAPPPPPHPASAPASTSLPLHPHLYFQHQQHLLSLHLSSTSTPAPGQQHTPTTTPLPTSAEPPPAPPSERPFRDDCWSENATLTLIQAWGDRYLELNRGNLKQKHWKDVANSVNSRPLTSSKPSKTDVQCKNRLDTLKKKYKIEKSKLVTGGAPSKWAFFDRLDELIGSSKKPKTPPLGKTHRAVASVADGNCTMNPDRQFSGTSAAKCVEEDVKPPLFFLPPQATVSALPLPITHHVSSGSAHMNHGALHVSHYAGAPIYHHLGEAAHMNHHGGTPPNHLASGIAALNHHVGDGAATADTASKSKAAGPDMSQSSPLQNRPIDSKRSKRKRDRHRPGEESPFRDLARAIFKFGEVYERVENAKLQQVMDIEKQRMEFTKDLEIQRLQLFMQTQVELAKMKHGSSKHSNAEHHI